MSPALLPRSSWTTEPRPALTPLDPDRVVGFAVHYTGASGRLGDTPTLAQSADRLERERVDHVAGRGWRDIAYQAAVDQAGRLFDLRGVDAMSAANGDELVNSTHGAITVLVGTDDVPTPAAVEAVRWWRQNVWLRRWPHATRVVGHRDLHSTECPGDRLTALVRSGAFSVLTQPAGPGAADPTTIPGGVRVALTDAEIEAIALRTRDKVLAIHWGDGADGKPYTLGLLLAELVTNTRQILAQQQRPAGGATGTTDPAAVAAAVVDDLVTRLAGPAQ